MLNQNDSDIVCITETWLSNEIPNVAIALKDFTLFRKDRERRGGGIATLWLQIRPCRLPRAVSSILIAVVYHASVDDNFKLYDHIQDVVDSYLLGHSDSLICIVGEFNPNSTKISPNRFRELCGLIQIVKMFTRDSGILDWCLTNKPKIMSLPKRLPKIG